jgi:TonB family protein
VKRLTTPKKKSLFLFETEFKLQARNAAINLTFLRRVGDFLMRVHRGTVAILCTGVVLADAHLARAQDATSANLPEQFETRKVMPTPRPKRKKAEPSLKIASSASSQKLTPVTEQRAPLPEGPVTAAMSLQKKTRAKKRTAQVAQPEAAISLTPTPLSLPAAQAIAVSAPLPEYPYQAKRANITGSGVCVMAIDSASGKVTDVMMAQSTGDAILDKATTNTFRRWRFKPGTVSQVRIPVDYE